MTGDYQWDLAGAGRANVVFTYHGESSFYDGMVLRVRKEKEELGTEMTKTVWSEIWREDEVDLLECSNRFLLRYIAPVLGQQYLDIGKIVHVPETITCTPGVSSRGVLLPDKTIFAKKELNGWSTLGSCLCVEIKPKSGFLPTAATIHPSRNIKKRICRFQLQQHLKLSLGRVKQFSEYCPLNLFSGDRELMITEITRLLLTPQNNIALFLNGQRLSPDKTNLFPEKEILLDASISRQLNQVFPAVYLDRNQTVFDILIDVVVDILRQEDILGKILKLQELDRHDIEGIYPLYCSLLKDFSPSSAHVMDSVVESDLFNIQACNTPQYSEEEVQEYENAHEELLDLPVEKKFRQLRDFLISLTAKDCSIFLTIQLVEDKTPNKEVSGRCGALQTLKWKDGNSEVLYKVRVGDLDLKPLTKIQYHKNLDDQILRQCMLNEDCID